MCPVFVTNISQLILPERSIMFNALSATKFVVSGLVGIGTAKIVTQVIKNNVTSETLIDKVTMLAAAWSIGGVAAKVTKKYTEDSIDDIAKGVVFYVDKAKLASKLGRINREESTFEKEGLTADDYRKSPETNKWVKIDKDPEGDLIDDEEHDTKNAD